VLALRILALHDEQLQDQLEQHARKMADEVATKNKALLG
jgi:phosphoribosylcarboxyaminoimidazole (NCAIR) mutase